ncbi:hypothetical protein NDU88_009494 [Pleurodeles waltl]|uniref:Uncharacterized protein n=1 Tax=Pleurodeles waltl TaxID=8319 RepID=A0AAV7RWE2_PLEWA|nr:hypothetical protein NDU88_009494 [Pleurodeles waltl]
MPPKGAKTAALTGRGKPLRISASIRQWVTTDIKHGSGEKTNPKIKNASLDRFLEKGKDILAGGIDARAPSAVAVADQSMTIKMEGDEGLPPQEGGGTGLRFGCSAPKETHCR